LVLDSIRAIDEGTLSPQPQEDSLATFAPLIKPEDTHIDWNDSALNIHHQIRGLSPRPGAFTHYLGNRLQILKSQCVAEADPQPEAQPGQVLRADRKGLWVHTGEGVLQLLTLKPENRSPLTGIDFVNGYRLKVGNQFG
jgi:methionyl-tRNA formyltransferase